MAITISTTLGGMTALGDVITTRQMGMNLAQGYERFGTLPWEKFDEVQAAIGATVVRFPGGTEAETAFDYANFNATTGVSAGGGLIQLTTPEQFGTYCNATGTKGTYVLATKQLLTNAAYGARDFDASKTALVRAYVDFILNKVGPAGVSTFELGNEYESYMTSAEYGRVASRLGTIVKEQIDKYYAAHPTNHDARPDIAVQVWTLSIGGSQSLSDLAARNRSVMAEFSASELQAITATSTHFYYTEGKFAGQVNAHSYANISAALSYSVSMLNDWQAKTGRELDTIFSEWNVQLKDSQTYGLQQIPVLLEMFSTLAAAGVDEMDIWSAMYNGTALADYRGGMQAAGTIMQILSKEIVGMRVADVPVASASYDVHAFTNGGKTYLMVSSLSDAALDISLGLGNYIDRYVLTSARVIGVDEAGADGVYRGVGGYAPWEEADAPITVTAQNWVNFLVNGVYGAHLDPHETLVLELNRAPIRFGSMKADTMTGKEGQGDRIDAMASNDKIYGLSGNDTLFGGDGSDQIWGGEGADRLWGGLGLDTLYGGNGNDTLEGRANRDQIFGDAGNDYVSGGDLADTLWGGAGADAFVFRSTETGSDLVVDFNAAEGDFLVWEGTAAARASDFVLERKALAGVGTSAAELLVHYKSGGPVIAILQDDGALTRLLLQDTGSGAMLTLA